jgi:hypothetical protein
MRYTDDAWFAIGRPGATVTISATLANRLRAWSDEALHSEWQKWDKEVPDLPRFQKRINAARARKLAAILRDLDAIRAALKPHGLGDGRDVIEDWARRFVAEHAE